jgi:hypothetical protein
MSHTQSTGTRACAARSKLQDLSATGASKKRGYSTREAGEYIGRSASWLRKKRLRGADDPGDPGPRHLMPESGSAIYLREDLDAWLNGLAERRPIAPQLRGRRADGSQ